MGVLPEASRARRRGRRAVHPEPYYQCDGEGIRRLCRLWYRPGCKQAHARSRVEHPVHATAQISQREWAMTKATTPTRRIRYGMVGGGQGAFIGAVHRIAARMDDRFELVAGALSSDPQRAQTSAAEAGIARSYADWREMARAQAARHDGIDAVAIVTPNH